MDDIEQDFSPVLLAAHAPPCLSLYQPTHRHYPEREQDPIRFRNLVATMETSLQQNYPASDGAPLLTRFRELAEDRAFWNRALDGLAVLAAPELFKVYRLQQSVPELAVVADSFHTKPLLRILQSANRYQILGLTRQSMRLFEGNRSAVDEIEPAPEVPRTVTDVVGATSDQQEHHIRAHGAEATPWSGSRHGTDVKEERLAGDTERFFRAVDRAVLQHHSRPSGMPLILAALPEHHHLFRAVSRSPFLVAGAIDTNPDALSLDSLRQRAWQVFEPRYRERLSGLIDRFHAAKSAGRGSDDLAEVGREIVSGRIAALLIAADRTVRGDFDATTGAIRLDDHDRPGTADVLDDLGERALRTGSEVTVIPADRMPAASGIAAIYRF